MDYAKKDQEENQVPKGYNPDSLLKLRPTTKTQEEIEEEKEDEEYRLEQEEKAVQKHKQETGVALDPESVLGKVYPWVAESRAEQNLCNGEYLWSRQGETIINRLKRTSGNMILIIGGQGIGKSEMCQQLPYALSEDPDSTDGKTLAIKWTGEKEYWKVVGVKPVEYYMELMRRIFKDHTVNDLRCDLNLPEKESTILSELRKDTYEIPKNYYEFFTSALVPKLERYAGKIAVAEVKQSVFADKLDEYRHILIDTADYNKNKLSQLDHHLNQIQDFWNHINKNNDESCADYETHLNLVVFIQKEIHDKFKHFFLGKFNPKFILEPFKAKTLVNFYKHKFDSTAPFTEEALTEIAVLSRGYFRRYKTYIGICLDNTYTMTKETQGNTNLLLEREINNIEGEREKDSIEIERDSESKEDKNSSVIVSLRDVHNWIKDKILIQDQELELVNVFPKNKAHRNITVQLLRRLSHGDLKQSDIADDYFENEKSASRFLSILEANDYIKRTYDGKDKLVSLVNLEEN